MAGNAPSIINQNNARPTESGVTYSLENILGDHHEKVEHPRLKQQELDAPAAEGWDEESANQPTAEGLCVECEGRSAPYSAPSF